MTEYQENSIVQVNERLADTTYRLTLHAPQISAVAQPGQFIMAACGSTLDPLLRRPFSIHLATAATGTLQLLFKVIGRGTTLLSALRPGEVVSMVGPLGQGFRFADATPVCLIGGGMGIAPLLFLARSRSQLSFPADSCTVLLGSRTATDIQQLVPALSEMGCSVHTATDDGSLGHHGLISDLLPPFLPHLKKVYVCGPFAMMATVARLCRDMSVPCEASLEAHMACGLGACLGCTIHGADSQYIHVCKQGPVLNAEEVAWTR